MWQSQDDIVKDLASLDDFNVLGDKEPYKVLYSIGRGSKCKSQQRSSKKFLDSRTGEIVDLAEELLDYNDLYKGKGRGSLLGGYSRSKFQLQQQLRLARPLGSGDEAIESYCRRHHAGGNFRCSINTSDSESDTKNDKIVSGTSSNSSPVTVNHRIKGVRNSNVDNNALISGLLTKSKENAKIINKKENFFNHFDEENPYEAITVKSNGHSFGKDSTSGNGSDKFLRNFKDEVLFEKYQNGKGINSSSSESTEANESSLSSIASDGHDIISDEEGKEKWGDEGSKNYSRNVHDSTKQQTDRDEHYRILGERLNSLREIDPKTSGNGIYDFSHISKYIAKIDVNVDVNSNSPLEIRGSPGSNCFFASDEEFSPLHKL